MQLKIYQENAIDELLTKTKQLLSYSGKKIIHMRHLTNIFRPAILESAKNARPVPSNRNTAGFYISEPFYENRQNKDFNLY